MAISFIKKPLKVLFVASEAAPFSRAGGLGGVMFSLPRSLKDLGCDARVMIPRYATIDQEKFKLKLEMKELEVPTDSTEENQPSFLICNVKRFDPIKNDPHSPVTTYFLENQEYYETRANIYGYADDSIRWALLSRGTLEFLRLNNNWTPDVIVASDWQTGFIPNYLATVYKEDKKISKIATIFCIHNLYYQGMFDHRFIGELDFDDGKSRVPSFFDPRLSKINCMRRGIMYSDVINTVSPTYAQEIMTPEYGELLDDLLRERRLRVHGILNGIDYEEINPEKDHNLVAKYNVNSLEKRVLNKIELQSKFNLEKDKDKFVICISSRLDEQKGFDLLLPIGSPLLKQLSFQLIIVGEGNAKYMSFFQELEKSFPNQVATHLKFDEILPHLLWGGADAILIPSRFEPCGLVQMEAMRYGCVPIARKTGGLADTIENYQPAEDKGTGFVFDEYDPFALNIAIVRAWENYHYQKIWKKIQKRAMQQDFSWQNSAKKYMELFLKAIEFHNKA